MADLTSPFADAGHISAFSMLPEDEPLGDGITFNAIALHGAFEVNALASEKSVGSALAKATGTKVIEPQRFVAGQGTRVICLEPVRWLVHTGLDQIGPLQKAVGDAGTVVDVSHARSGFEIAGARAEDAMRKYLKLDLHPDRCPPGSALEAPIHHMGCLILRLAEDRFQLYTLSSLAESLLETMADAAIEYGARMGDPIEVVG